MANELRGSEDTTNRLNADRKMIGILSVFAVLGICLVVTIVVATNTLSALRGFASLQTHWTEARKEVSMQLLSYIQTGEQQHYLKFRDAIQSIESASNIREELLRENPDYQSVRSNFLKIHTVPKDIEIMISTFERFSDFRDFKDAMQQWIISDQLVRQMEELSDPIHKQIEAGTVTESFQKEVVAKIYELDQELTNVQYKLAGALTAGTHFLQNVILWVSLSLGVILLASGGFLSFRFLKSLKGWRRAIDISEQQYRSLFDHNPNAVYSISRKGEFLSGNKGLEEMIGYPLEELKGANFSKFVPDSELERVSAHFQRALEGHPQTYEATGIRKGGEHIHAEITNLPIYVDGKIVGVYGIARDISIRKKKEKEIKIQLEEKIHLLAEVHDRVKNNLALILSLIKLQQENIPENQQSKLLEDTISRIHSMAIVHEQLYQTESFSKIRLDKYLEEFCNSLSFATSEEPQKSLTLQTDSVMLNIKQAIPTALLVNELITNACKYGGNGSAPAEIDVRLKQVNDQISFEVTDNGPGLPEEVDLQDPNTLGFKLIRGLVKQLEATLQMSREAGTKFAVQFKKESHLNDN